MLSLLAKHAAIPAGKAVLRKVKKEIKKEVDDLLSEPGNDSNPPVVDPTRALAKAIVAQLEFVSAITDDEEVHIDLVEHLLRFEDQYEVVLPDEGAGAGAASEAEENEDDEDGITPG